MTDTAPSAVTTPEAALDALLAHERVTIALEQTSGLLGWDQETMMPRGAQAQRAEWQGALRGVIHARRTDPRIGEWLALAEQAPPDDTARAQLRLIRRAHERATRVPADLAVALARETAVAQGIWAEARANDDFAAFAPTLERVLSLKRQEGAALAAGGDPYDALLQDYEPGMTAARIEGIFAALRPGLIALRDRIRARPPVAPLGHRFDPGRQMQLAEELAEVFGYDLNRGRIDKAVHPFSSGSGDDVRITTRTDPVNPFNCIYSTIHETGHAAYEQNIDRAYLLTPLGRGVSMGVHESQSRIFENQLGRARPFTGWLYGRMRDLFGDFGCADAERFHAAANAVDDGFIRTEADEVQYNLHIFLRFDLERALIAGDLRVGDLEAAWNDRFRADFGLGVTRPSDGVLQDVHWSVGLFGYFPTYALGNIYAGCLYRRMRADLPDLDAALARGDPGPATRWLAERVQRFGGLLEPAEVIARASGGPVGPEPLLAYLEEKFAAIYGL